MVSLATLGTLAATAAVTTAVTFAVIELTKPDIPGVEEPPGLDSEEVRAAQDKERRRRAALQSRASTILTKETLGEPLPELQQKKLLGA